MTKLVARPGLVLVILAGLFVRTARWRPALPASVLARRRHGSLDVMADSERRALRPIGMSAYEAAARTDVLLLDLAVPDLRIFQGLRAGDHGEPPIGHAVNAGRQVVLIDSVAWPSGRYSASNHGLVHCDGTYIGQSVTPLLDAVSHWRRRLPRGHQVSALVVVHAIDLAGPLSLPAPAPDLGWACAADALRNVKARLGRRQRRVGGQAVAALAAAVGETW